MSDALERYKKGEEINFKDLDFALFLYILYEKINIVIIYIVILFLIFMVGYYHGYSHGINYMNDLIVKESMKVINWTI